MKHLNLFFILILFLSLSSVAWVQTPFYDGFTGTGFIGGDGAVGTTSNGWTTHSGTAGTIDIVTGSLSYTGLQASTGDKVYVLGNNTTLSRDVNAPIFLGVTTIAYFSTLVNVADNTQLGTGGDYFMHFGQTAGSSVSVFPGRLGIKSVNAGANFRFAIQNTSGGTPTFTDFETDLNFGTTYLVVVKVDISVSPIVATLWVNPSSLGGTEPAGGVSNNSGTGAITGFASICIRNGSNTPKAYYDEIRAGLTWASVTPPYVAGTSTITVSTGTLTGFGYILGSGPSGEQSFSISGSDLTNNISITAPTNYEISTGTGGSFVHTSPIILTQSGGTVNSTTIYVRLKSGLNAGTYNGEAITASSSGASDKTVTCSGGVYKLEPTNHATAFASTAGSPPYSTINISWIDATGGTTPDGYLIKASPVSFAAIVDPVDGTPESNSDLVRNINQGVQLWNFTGLTPGTTYYFKIFPYTNSSTNINYKTDAVPTTSLATGEAPAPTLLFDENFDYAAGQLTTVSLPNWVNFSGTGNFIQVLNGNLSYSGYVSSDIGRKIDIVSTGTSAEDVYRQFTSQGTGTTTYASFLVNLPNTTGLAANNNINGDYFVAFLPSTSTSAYNSRVSIRLGTVANTYQIGLRARSTNEGAVWSSTDLNIGTTNLIVFSYQVNSGSDNDVASLWINPTLGGSQPTADLTQVSDADIVDVSRFAVRQGTTTTPNASIDGIRVAGSWNLLLPLSTDPTITVSTTSLPNFGNVVVGENSAPQSYTVSGSNLTADISINAPAGFGISLTSGGTYGSSLTLPQSGGTVNTTPIYARFSPSAAQGYSGNITHTSSGATQKDVAVSGTGISGIALEPTIQASNVNFTNVGGSSMTVNWTIGNGANRIVLARSGSAVNSDPTDGSSYTANAAFGSGSQIGTGNYVVYSGSGNSVTVTGLSSTTTYHFAVYEYNGSGGTQNYLMSPAIGNQITAAPEATISYTTVASEYTQDFNGLPNSGTFTYTGLDVRHLAATPVFAAGMSGWYFVKNTGTGANDLFHVETGTLTSGGTKSYGFAGINPITDRALGGLGSGSYAPKFGALITNNTGVELNKFTITFTGEQWRVASTNVNTLTFKYAVGATSINDASIADTLLNFKSPILSTTAAALDGNDPANRTVGITSTVYGLTWAPGTVLAIRWDKIDDPGSDNGIAIDDLTFSAGIQPIMNFYYAGTGDLHSVTNWGTNSNGTGTNPTDFTSPSQTFHIRNTSSVSTTAPWTVSGPGSKVVVGNGTDNLALTISNGSALNGSVDISANATVILQDATLPSFNSLSSNSTVNYAQSGTVAVSNSPTYGNLTLTGGTKTIPSGNTTVMGNVVVDAVTDLTGSGTLVLAGNLTLQNGTTMAAGMSLNCNGTSAQTIRGNGTDILLFRLTHGNTAGITLSTTGGSSNVQITGTSGGNLVLGANKITTSTNYVSVLNAAAISRTTGYIIGNFRKSFDIGSTVAHTFEIGDASNYTPVTVTFAAVLNGGYITASTTAGDHSAIGTSGIHENKSVNRFWTLLNGGIVFDNYSATFNFVSGDVDPGANTDNFIVKRYNSGWFTPTTGLRTATSTEATGIVGFGDFAIGESSSALIFQVANSWNMVSVPLTVPNYSKSVLFPTAISNAFAYSAGYQPKDILENGVGYWIKFGSQQDISMEGIARTSDSVAVALGWNMIGSISTQIGTANVTPSSGIIISSQFFGYAGGYSPAATINPGKAYWVKVSGAGKLYFNSGSLSKESVSEVKTLDNLNSITITDAAGSSQTLYFGADIDGTFSVDYYELPPTAPEGVMDVRYNSQRMVEVHPTVIEKSQAYPITISSAVFPLTISWNITNGNSAVYQLSEGKNTTTLTASGSIKITDENIQSISLKAGSAELLPTEFSLGQNYPNPFNPSTKFTIAIPKNAEVNVSVYDILGRKISDLVNGQMTAGYHTIEWNGKADAGYTVPSGIYFIKMTSNSPDSKNFSAVRKVTLLK